MDEIKLKFCKNCGCATPRQTDGKCKPCRKVQTAKYRDANRGKMKAYRTENAEKLAAQQSAWREANKARIAVQKAEYRAANKVKISSRKAAYSAANKEKEAARYAAWVARNKDWVAAYNAVYRSEHRAQINACNAAWKKANPHISNAEGARRRAAKLRATPAWANLDAIKAIYAETARVQRETGIPHDTDHIVPLQSPIVCGLHCEANLATITAKANREKNNRWWPDMP